MQIVLFSMDAIRPFDRIPRHKDTAVPAVVESVRRCASGQPIVVHADNVIA